jgi:hypothetical protein
MSIEKIAKELSQQGLIFYEPEQNEWGDRGRILIRQRESQTRNKIKTPKIRT